MSIEQTRAHYEAMAAEAAAINDGGPAFPIPNLHHDEDFNGMTLRDYFAAKALIGLLAESVVQGYSATAFHLTKDENIVDTYAISAYKFADAMLAARGVA